MEISLRPGSITPETFRVKLHLRRLEGGLYNTLMSAGGRTGLGVGTLLDSQDKPTSDKFTGRGLCLLGSLLLKEDLEENFPLIKTTLTAGMVSPRDTFRQKSHQIGHFWLRLKLADGTGLFLDATYGQIHPWLNRIVLDSQQNEIDYYGTGMQTYHHSERRNSDQVLEDLIREANNRLSKTLVYSH